MSLQGDMEGKERRPGKKKEGKEMSFPAAIFLASWQARCSLETKEEGGRRFVCRLQRLRRPSSIPRQRQQARHK